MAHCDACDGTLVARARFCVVCRAPVSGEVGGTAVTTEIAVPDPTVEVVPVLADRTEILPVPARRSRRSFGGIITVVVLGLAIGAALAVLDRPEPDGEVVARAELDTDGTVLGFANGGRLEVPAGAVERDTTIVVRRYAQAGPARVDLYSFEPTDLVFNLPVELTLPAAAPGVPAELWVRTEDGDGIVTGESDAESGTVTVLVRDLAFADAAPEGT